MKKSKKNNNLKISLTILILIILSVIIMILTRPKPKYFYKELPAEYIITESIYDTSSKEKLFGASDYAFVGKVNKILRTEHVTNEIINSTTDKTTIYIPYTVYSVEVVKNIKGNLIENIEVYQYGGLHKDEKKYIIYNNNVLLNNDEYYIFFTYLNDNDGPMYLEFSNQNISLGKTFDEKDELISTYQKALKNEIVLDEGTYMIPKVKYYSIFDRDKNK